MARMRAERLDDLVSDGILFTLRDLQGLQPVARFQVADLVRFYGHGRTVNSMRLRCAECGTRRFDLMPKDPGGERERPKPVSR